MSVPGKFKRNLQNQITVILLLIFTLYAWLFIPDFRSSTLSEGLQLLAEVLRVGVAAIVVWPVRWILFSQDSLANGSSQWSRFFRAQYPHRIIVEKFGCTQAEATTLWFHWFNRWEHSGQLFQGYHSMTFQRSYGCRFIYLLRRWLLLFAAFGTANLSVIHMLDLEFAAWLSAFACITASLILFTALTCSNRVPRNDEKSPSGCWLKYQEISEVQRVLLEREILDHADSLDDAWARVKKWDDRTPAM